MKIKLLKERFKFTHYLAAQWGSLLTGQDFLDQQFPPFLEKVKNNTAASATYIGGFYAKITKPQALELIEALKYNTSIKVLSLGFSPKWFCQLGLRREFKEALIYNTSIRALSIPVTEHFGNVEDIIKHSKNIVELEIDRELTHEERMALQKNPVVLGVTKYSHLRDHSESKHMDILRRNNRVNEDLRNQLLNENPRDLIVSAKALQAFKTQLEYRILANEELKSKYQMSEELVTKYHGTSITFEQEYAQTQIVNDKTRMLEQQNNLNCLRPYGISKNTYSLDLPQEMINEIFSHIKASDINYKVSDSAPIAPLAQVNGGLKTVMPPSDPKPTGLYEKILTMIQGIINSILSSIYHSKTQDSGREGLSSN